MDEQERIFLIVYGMIIGIVVAVVLIAVYDFFFLISIILAIGVAIFYPILNLARAGICIRIRTWAYQKECDSWIDAREPALRNFLLALMPLTLIVFIFFNISYGTTNRIFK